MPIITFKHNGKVYRRQIQKYENGVYIIHSRGLQYWFRKDAHVTINNGWHQVNGSPLPDFMIELVAKELEKLAQ